MFNSQIQLRHLFKIISGSTPESGKGNYWDGHIYWATPEDVSGITDGHLLKNTKRKITKEGYEESGVNLAAKGSIILTKRAPIGQVAILDIEACCNQGCFLLSPKNGVSSRYYYYLILSLNNWLQALGRGSTFLELSLDDIKSLKVPQHSIANQQALANFLDKETSRIDSMILAKEKLIKLLEEKKQALITKAVTKGLDTNVKMKDSGIEWLGEIPEQWELIKISRIFRHISSGTTPSSTEKRYYQNGEINWINTGDLNDGILIETEKKITQAALEDYTTLKVYPAKSLCIAMYGATIGKTALTAIEACTNQACCVLYGSKVANIEFVQFWFIANRNNITNLANGGGQPNISQGIIRDLKMPLPSVDEQERILVELKRQLAQIEKLILLTRKSKLLLIERRNTLITSTVTGIKANFNEN